MKGAMLRTITRRAVHSVNHMAMWLIWLAGWHENSRGAKRKTPQ